jgi:predicted hydrocarbon binding protein/predicted transcriptional regulator
MNEDLPIGAPASSFAELISSFNKLTQIESRISTAIEKSKVPRIETRKYLKGTDVKEIANTPLAQFITNLFNEIGLGKLTISDASHLIYTYVVKECPICNLFSDVEDRRVCNPTVDALNRFFANDLELITEIEETKCINAGDKHCEFRVTLQPLPVYQIAFDTTDNDIIKELESMTGGNKAEDIAKKLKMDEDDVRNRFKTLMHFQIINDKQKLSKAGETYRDFITKYPPKDQERFFQPPWNSMYEITSAIAAAQSFAEAFIELQEDESLPWELDDAEVVDIREKAKGKKGFAEMLSDTMSEDDDDEK